MTQEERLNKLEEALVKQQKELAKLIKAFPRCKRPTLEECANYRREKQLALSAEEFYDKNEAAGWVIYGSGKPVRDWKAHYRVQNRTHLKYNAQPSNPQSFMEAYKGARR